MLPKDYERYIALCKKFYRNDKDFAEFVKLHNLKSSIEKVEPWDKLLTEMTNV